jgi:hypothetical protein
MYIVDKCYTSKLVKINIQVEMMNRLSFDSNAFEQIVMCGAW